jgi:hypothetical protein
MRGKPFEHQIFRVVKDLQEADQKVEATRQACARADALIQRLDYDMRRMESLI